MEESLPLPVGFSTMPPEIKRLILLKAPIAALLNACSVSKEFDAFCTDDNFWREKLKLDYDITDKPSSFSWRRTYYEKAKKNLGEVEVLVKGKSIPKGIVHFSYNQPIPEVVNDILKRVPNLKARIVYLVFYPNQFGPDYIEEIELVRLHHYSTVKETRPDSKLVYAEVAEERESRLILLADRKIIYLWVSVSNTLEDLFRNLPPFTVIVLPLGADQKRRFIYRNTPESRSRKALETLRNHGLNSRRVVELLNSHPLGDEIPL